MFVYLCWKRATLEAKERSKNNGNLIVKFNLKKAYHQKGICCRKWQLLLWIVHNLGDAFVSVSNSDWGSIFGVTFLFRICRKFIGLKVKNNWALSLNYAVLERLWCRPVVFVTNFIPEHSTKFENGEVYRNLIINFIVQMKQLVSWNKNVWFKNEEDGYKRDFALIILFIKRQSNDRKIRWI